MTPRLTQGMAIALSTFAGFVDAQGYLALGGLFVAFMSGNSTVLGVSLVGGWGGRTPLAAGLVAAFVVGVMIGTWVGRPFGARRPPYVLLLMGVLLAVSALMNALGWTALCGLLAAVAMGAENTVFQRDGQAGIGLTYMTGTLVRFGQKVAEALTGGPWSATVPDALLWLGMVVGAALGAETHRLLGLDGLWIAVGVSALMAGFVRRALR